MDSAVGSVTIDLRMETIKKGSPHTLRLIKTQAAYEKDLANWRIDVSLLEEVENSLNGLGIMFEDGLEAFIPPPDGRAE